MSEQPRPWNPQRTMWAAIGGSFVLLGVLLALGWGHVAWSAAASVLLLSCILVCLFAVLQSRTTDREVRDAVARLAAQREAEELRRRPKNVPRG